MRGGCYEDEGLGFGRGGHDWEVFCISRKEREWLDVGRAIMVFWNGND